MATSKKFTPVSRNAAPVIHHRISPAEAAQWDFNQRYDPRFSQRTVINDNEMMYLIHMKKADIDLSKWWKTKDKRWILIEAMDLYHLQNTVDYFSQDGIQINPERQAALDNVIIEYMKKKVDGIALDEKAQQLMENLDGKSEGTTDGTK